MAKCDHCSIDGPCNGEKNFRLCQLTDKDNIAYNPSYLKVLKPPGTLDKIGSIAGALYDWAVGGNVSDEVYDKRLSICRACDSFEDDHCQVCSCNMVIKCRIAEATCPMPDPKWTPSSFIPYNDVKPCIPCGEK